MPASPQLTVVLPTYNRSGGLTAAIDRALDQTAPAEAYELLVVDNNSTDRTAAVLETAARRFQGRLRPIVARRQGVSYARNAGIDAARAPIVAFCDDDVRVSRTWVETILRLFREHPDADCVGGKVLPRWEARVPRWLTRAHWAPLALQDYGDQPFYVGSDNPRGLISANLACRRTVLERIGGFSPQFQRVKDAIGSIEDDEWIRRFWKSGGRGLYAPDLIVTAEIDASRLSPAYHRRWHYGHGRFYAMLRADEMERTSLGSLFGVPAHLYRSALINAVGWMARTIVCNPDAAFLHETRLRFFAGFFAQRVGGAASLKGQPFSTFDAPTSFDA